MIVGWAITEWLTRNECKRGIINQNRRTTYDVGELIIFILINYHYYQCSHYHSYWGILNQAPSETTTTNCWGKNKSCYPAQNTICSTKKPCWRNIQVLKLLRGWLSSTMSWIRDIDIQKKLLWNLLWIVKWLYQTRNQRCSISTINNLEW